MTRMAQVRVKEGFSCRDEKTKKGKRKQCHDLLILALALKETGAGNGIRTRDPRLGKAMLYR